MGTVVEFYQEPKAGETAFAHCSCTEEGTPYVCVAIVGDAPFIAALVCPDCGAEKPVVNGYIMAD